MRPFFPPAAAACFVVGRKSVVCRYELLHAIAATDGPSRDAGRGLDRGNRTRRRRSRPRRPGTPDPKRAPSPSFLARALQNFSEAHQLCLRRRGYSPAPSVPGGRGSPRFGGAVVPTLRTRRQPPARAARARAGRRSCPAGRRRQWLHMSSAARRPSTASRTSRSCPFWPPGMLMRI